MMHCCNPRNNCSNLGFPLYNQGYPQNGKSKALPYLNQTKKWATISFANVTERVILEKKRKDARKKERKKKKTLPLFLQRGLSWKKRKGDASFLSWKKRKDDAAFLRRFLTPPRRGLEAGFWTPSWLWIWQRNFRVWQMPSLAKLCAGENRQKPAETRTQS